MEGVLPELLDGVLVAVLELVEPQGNRAVLGQPRTPRVG
jgi:hypothetical protein